MDRQVQDQQPHKLRSFEDLRITMLQLSKNDNILCVMRWLIYRAQIWEEKLGKTSWRNGLSQKQFKL